MHVIRVKVDYYLKNIYDRFPRILLLILSWTERQPFRGLADGSEIKRSFAIRRWHNWPNTYGLSFINIPFIYYSTPRFPKNVQFCFRHNYVQWFRLRGLWTSSSVHCLEVSDVRGGTHIVLECCETRFNLVPIIIRLTFSTSLHLSKIQVVPTPVKRPSQPSN